ncbi:hypothetical protein LEP1GSC021_2883 [Leptospira noguchii str. 1993005606]|uniref:Uncharacterized protein n=1 Tax=Leptospira noguchii str. 2001034031 TaxID=1193053 RepID=M6Y7K5_9LEPT|nr:hypothetical protein LEP1GSC024_0649 [Leptospira noguchii str. 2001034031]EPE82174.1 hypothetical protein LEP1GSC021_2883 [Leptospira noguchii str. 1993005606]
MITILKVVTTSMFGKCGNSYKLQDYITSYLKNILEFSILSKDNL